MARMHLVTGAAGHLGSAVVRALLADGDCSIRALVMAGDPAIEHLPPSVQRCPGNLLDPASLEPFFQVPPDTECRLVHCAGIVSTQSNFSQMMQDVNVAGTQNILDACVRHAVSKMVHVSSVHAIPVLPGGQTMQEVNGFDPVTVDGPYARTKAEATALVLKAAAEGLDVTIVCPTGIVGPYDYGQGHVTQLVIDFCQGRISAVVPGGFDFVDVRDVAAAIVSALDHGRRGESYILGNRYVSAIELVDMLATVTGRRRIRLILPIWLARAFAPLLSVYYHIRRQPPLFSAYSLSTLSVNSDYSHAKAVSELGFCVRPMQDTIRDTVAWLKQEHRI